MATSFTRSTRSLQDTDFRKLVVNLILVLAIVILWGLWFFLASIALYEISEPLQLTEEEILVVNFPLAAQGRVQRGQQALIKLEGDIGAEVGVIPALVTDVHTFLNEARVEATLFSPWMLALDLRAHGLPGHDELMGWVEVEVEHLSPASLVVRAVNNKLKSPAIKFTPRDTLEVNHSVVPEK